MFNKRRICLIFVLYLFSNNAFSNESDSTCSTWFHSEKYLLNSYIKTANFQAKEYGPKETPKGLKKHNFKSFDGQKVSYLKWESKKPRGYVVVSLGNALLPAIISSYFKIFSDIGLDTYMIEYRGYGFDESSKLEPNIKNIVKDYSTLISQLNSNPVYKRKFVLGSSSGGAVLMSALSMNNIIVDAASFDSVPDKLKIMGVSVCKKNFIPILLLPRSCKDWIFINGDKDQVIGSESANRLGKKAESSCGGTHLILKNHRHQFMEKDSKHIPRLSITKEHFQKFL